MKTGEGEKRMLISALLGLLRHHEVDRVNVGAKKAETYPEVTAAGVPEGPPPASLRQAGKEDLEAARLLRPLISEDKPPLPLNSNGEYASFIKAVDQLERKPRDHSLDVFE